MKKNAKKLFALLSCGALALSLAACGGEQAPDSGSKTDAADAADAADTQGSTYQVGVILKTTSSEYWSYVIAGVE